MSRQPITIHDEMSRQRAVNLVAALALTKAWQVTIEPKKARRSLSQNALYWSWVDIIARETGNDNDDVHEGLKQKFLAARVIQINGEAMRLYTTAKLEKAAMTEYLDRVYAWATAELGLLLPVPEEMGRR